MALNNKIFRAEMYGYNRAYEFAKEKGLDALKLDIKKRNCMGAPVQYTSSQLDDFWNQLSENLFQTMLVTCSYTLVETFGFGKKRLGDFHESLSKNIDNLKNLDYMGDRYVNILDYAEEIKGKIGFDIDIARIAANEDIANERDKNYHMMKLENACDDLRKNGFEDAANFLMSKVR